MTDKRDNFEENECNTNVCMINDTQCVDEFVRCGERSSENTIVNNRNVFTESIQNCFQRDRDVKPGVVADFRTFIK